ncbi:hypothetical protein C8R44DRAFT_887773 [Mycena epipterygia]|nr:hypothetical protein C8R44DRAFT_887773 [Mycena epipterygia]
MQSQQVLIDPSLDPSAPMFFTTLFLMFVAATASVQAVAIPRADPPPHMPVFTATRVYQTITDVAPYIITATTTMTWTQSPSTTIAHPTGPGL